MRVLVIRMMGLGDIASILMPAIRMIRRQNPGVKVDALTYGAGVELIELMPEVDNILAVSREQWPDDLIAGVASFMRIAEVVRAQGYDLVINIDTWFMPCVLARILKDTGVPLSGNFINIPAREFLDRLSSGRLTQVYIDNPNLHMASTFPRISDWWKIPWWNAYEGRQGYPEYFLSHCCGLEGEVDLRYPADDDVDFKALAAGKKIIALSTAGSSRTKQYRHGKRLAALLEEVGFHVWSQFDGSVPMKTTLDRLKVTDLLVTVPTSTHWLARMVGCPSLMIPGAEPPSVAGADLIVDRFLECQYCFLQTCPANKDFACMDVAPEVVLAKVLEYFRR